VLTRPFELEWLGGATERLLRKRRPTPRDVPWGSYDLRRYPPELLARAQVAWTQGALSEYSTAVALARLSQALLEAKAPIDLVANVADFIVDEMVHVELNARMAMELGGAAPVVADLDHLGAESAAEDPRERAAELALRIACVGEAFSLPMLAAMARASRHALPRAILTRIAREEAPHAKAGGIVVAWALEGLDAEAHRRLAAAALDEIGLMTTYWAGLSPADPGTGRTRTGHEVDLVLELGWLEAGRYRDLARRAAVLRVIDPIAALGVPLDRAAALDVVLAA
jgi:hypothetical protein